MAENATARASVERVREYARLVVTARRAMEEAAALNEKIAALEPTLTAGEREDADLYINAATLAASRMAADKARRAARRAPRKAKQRYSVGYTATSELLQRFDTEEEASAYIATLPGFEDGRYYLDGPDTRTHNGRG